jgi:hypothetical protein
MKKILLGLLLAVSSTVSASHILGGWLVMTHNPNTQPNQQSVALYLITDPQGIIPTTQTVKVYIENNNFYQFSEDVTVTKSFTDTMSDGNLLTTYVSAYTYFYLSKYRFIYSHCCRGMSVNASNSWNSDFLIGLDVDRYNAVNNNTPQPSYLPTVNVLKNDTVSFDMSSFIHDNFFENDSVQYEAWDALGQHANNTFVPLAPFTQLDNYGSYTVGGGGQVTWIPNTVGTFLTGYRIREWRSGVATPISTGYMQMAYVVNPSTIGIEEFELDGRKVIGVYDWNGRLIKEGQAGLKQGHWYIIQYTDGIEKLFIQ